MSKLNFVTWSRILHPFCTPDSGNEKHLKQFLTELSAAVNDVIHDDDDDGNDVTRNNDDGDDVTCKPNHVTSESLFGPGLRTVPGGDAYR